MPLDDEARIAAKLSSLRHETIRALNTLEPIAQILKDIDYQGVSGLPAYYGQLIEHLASAVHELRGALEESDFRK
jgi:hypothetical protein